MEFIDLKAQYKFLKTKIDKRISDVLLHGQYIMGPEVKELEINLAEYVGTKHAITCANGTDALNLSLMALGIKRGDAVFCPTFTYFASAEAISYQGATPIFVDSNKDTFNICTMHLEHQIQNVITKGELQPKAIMAVDLFGLPADYKKIQDIAERYNLYLIEDGAQGFGGRIGDERVGSFGDIATTSFFPAKPLGCYGDGGAVFTNNDKYAELIRSYRVHGKGKDKYDNVRIGINSRLDTIQAAILLEKLNQFPIELEARNKLAIHYNNELKDKFKLPFVPDGYYSSWAQYTIQTENRQDVMQEYKNKGIPTMIYYQRCMHNQTAYSSLKKESGEFPVAEKLARTVLSLPMHGYMELS